MNKIPITLAIAFAAAIGAVLGYWYRGQVQIAREQAAVHQFVAGPPHALALAPPSSAPLPLTGGWNSKPQPRSK
jgi:hypothetical protein